MALLISNTANDLIKRGEYLRGLRKLEEHILFLEEILERPIEPEYQVQFKKRQLNSIYQLEEQISRIEFDVESSYDFRVDQPLIIKNYLKDRVTGLPISGLKTKVIKLTLNPGGIDRYLPVRRWARVRSGGRHALRREPRNLFCAVTDADRSGDRTRVRDRTHRWRGARFRRIGL